MPVAPRSLGDAMGEVRYPLGAHTRPGFQVAGADRMTVMRRPGP